MDAEKPTILFTLIYAGETHQVQTYRNEYSSLMTLISDYLCPSGFGLCCGMGSCGTCLVQLTNSGSSIKRPVLACAISINDDLANAQIIIPDQFY